MTTSATPPPGSDGGEAGPSGSGPYGDRDLASAVGVLDLGRNGVEEVTVLTDEELTALDGLAASQLTATPYIDEHVTEDESRVLVAKTAMRSLMARHVVISEVEAAEFEERPLKDENLRDVAVEPRTLGALVLRRTSRTLVWFEREVSEGIHRLYYYPHDQDVVLEEEVTDDGVHMFSVMPLDAVPARVRHLVDQASVGRSDGPVTVLPISEVETDDEMGPQIGDTRALTVGSMLSRTENIVQRLVFHMTSSAVIAGQPSSDGEEISLMEVSADAIETLVRDLFRTRETGDDSADAAGTEEGGR